MADQTGNKTTDKSAADKTRPATPVWPEFGEVWRHYKGGEYVIVCTSTQVDEEGGQEMVTYYSLEKRQKKTQTRERFLELILPTEENGLVATTPRFRRWRMADGISMEPNYGAR